MSLQEQEDGTSELGSAYGEPLPNRRWGIVVFPDTHDGEPEWVLARGLYTHDRKNRRHIVTSATPLPGIFEWKDGGWDAFTVEERFNWMLCVQGGLEYPPSLLTMMESIYAEVVALSQDRTAGPLELSRQLLVQWVSWIRNREEDPLVEMKKLLEELEPEVEKLLAQERLDEADRRRPKGTGPPPVDAREFEATKRRIMEALQPDGVSDWATDIDNSLCGTGLWDDDPVLEFPQDNSCMLIARCIAHADASNDKIIAELQRIWTEELAAGFLQYGLGEAHTFSVSPEAITIDWILGEPRNWYFTGRIEVALGLT